MNVPVRDELLAAHPCETCSAVNTHLDVILADLGELSTDVEMVRHVLGEVVRWVVIQALAQFNGDVAPIIDAMQKCLNEPQNERLIHAFLEGVGQEASIQSGPVH